MSKRLFSLLGFGIGIAFSGAPALGANTPSLHAPPAATAAPTPELDRGQTVPALDAPQIRSRIKLSDLGPMDPPAGPTAPKEVLRTQRNVLRHDRMSYSFFGEPGSRIQEFIFRHADESTSLQIE